MIHSSNVALCVGLLVLVAFVTPSASALDVLCADDYFPWDLDHLATALVGHNVTYLDNTDVGDSPICTDDTPFMSGFDVVIFHNLQREITSSEQAALEAYIQGGGSLIVTGYDALYNPDDPRLADIVRSSTYGADAYADYWTVANVDHFITNGPFGDYRGQTLKALHHDMDRLTADTSRGAVALAFQDGNPYDKIVFTDVAAPGGSVGIWTGNDSGYEWGEPSETDNDKGLAILRNWLAGLADADADGVFDSDDDCLDTAEGDPVDANGCSTADDDGDGVLNDADDCADTPTGAAVDASGCPSAEQEPQGCCGATGPVAPLGLAIGMLLLSRFGAYARRGRRE